ncbi:DHBP synthase RibB-like alpha/beta domain-containing protein [Entophlyctis helioformis]|nr:DHBP synthase RibB-like alpha/beta domain-containing protein [Entophlyctis helioformis]
MQQITQTSVAVVDPERLVLEWPEWSSAPAPRQPAPAPAAPAAPPPRHMPPPPPPADRPETAKLDAAVALLRAGNVVAFPTETVYGLGANALDSSAVAKIFAAKGRPSDNPLIVHVSSVAMLETLLPDSCPRLPPVYADLVSRFWPGPLTVLVPRSDKVPAAVTAGHDSVAVRMPSHPVARALIERCGFPLAAPSANTSGRPSPTLASHVLVDLAGRVPLILDGGPCTSGVESTVVDGLRAVPAILRPGGVTYEQVRGAVGMEAVTVYSKHFTDKALEAAPTTPGMKYRHYTPNAEVVLFEAEAEAEAEAERDGERHTSGGDHGHSVVASVTDAALGKGLDSGKAGNGSAIQTATPGARLGVLRTGSAVTACPADALQPAIGNVEEEHLGDTAEEVARHLFRGLRDLEQRGCTVILVEGISDADHGLAVMNRIRKAASRVA